MHGVRNKQAHIYRIMHKALVSYHDLIKQVLFYVGNIAFDISGISTKFSYENMWRSHFCSFLQCFYEKCRISTPQLARCENTIVAYFDIFFDKKRNNRN